MKSERNTQLNSCTEPMMKLVEAAPTHSRTPACTRDCATAGLAAAASAATVKAKTVEDRFMLLPLTSGFGPTIQDAPRNWNRPASQVRFPQKRWIRRQASST